MRVCVLLVVSFSLPWASGCSDVSSSPSANRRGKSQTSSKINEADVLRLFRDLRAKVGIAPAPHENVTVRRATSRDCLSEINDTLRPGDRAEFIAAGRLGALDREGSCWVAQLHQELLGGQIAYFDDNGRLLMTWLPPEG